MELPEEFMGYDPMQLVLYGRGQREESPTSIMPWEWPSDRLSMTSQFMFELHMAYQYALMGRDWLRKAHPWGPHWFIQLWELSPNDKR